MSKIKINVTGEDIACLLAITIGGIYAICHPEKVDEAFENTVIGVLLIKIFW